ncbi:MULTISPECIES: amidohydrolase family protein [Rhizobium]|jgi:predicted TIM-barrel fold metal-dependent hydrolase|uniref:Amidohydrolase 2 n=1 Tax=Rhizobium leguminosarum bv. trifolii (strain WSM1325) TaxID=395491 RepID=C6AY48_RHILS|nr:amidohydrolase family protein [Rhizobium leguminosarum]ACS58197.1 amidohydrolase 2 [Rhizobium leguminosarum bv. trifolii WSM1325]MBY2907511.1 amidohydrolase family protein [Rhizobium leguminosarum]MBY2916416.1 amidohydrolase family protein [Rhizobium leguminosarum]MBY2935186.1 amidohydrolase family protein [Rhizobium leguminosarum]MBY2939379.1 amidohydrolase family protein [Rhizobium leguminosarum]
MSAADIEAPLCLPHRPLTRLPRAALPQGTVDTHFHVFRTGAPLNTPRSYTPDIATISDWIEFSGSLGIVRGILVQPSVYGRDNRVLLEALAAYPDRLRGVVVIDPETTETEIERLDRLGVRGVRINTRNKGGLPLAAARTLAESIAPLGWSLQLQINPEQLSDIAATLSGIRLPIVIDHLGFIPLARETRSLHVDALKRLMDRAEAYVKVTAPYRLTKDVNYDGFAEVGRALATSHAERLLWGSDWPHTELWDGMPDDTELVETMQATIDDPAVAEKIFVRNAEALFFGR